MPERNYFPLLIGMSNKQIDKGFLTPSVLIENPFDDWDQLLAADLLT